jgi:HlyD family secretion protein
MKKYLLLLTLPAVLLLWWGLGRGGSAPVVHFATVRQTTIESSVTTNGKVEPVQWAAARAEIAGVVRSINVQRGQQVVAGQVLVSLDSATAESEVAAAEARQQEARIEESTVGHGGKPAALASINDLVKNAQAAVTVARRNYESMQRLQAQQAATKLQVQETKDALDRANNQLTAAQDQRRTLVTASDETLAKARLRDADAAVSLAQHHLALENVTAPMSGTVYNFDLKVGAFLQPGGLVALVGNIDRMKATVYVDEPDLGRVGIGMPVSITWNGHPGRVWRGTVDRMPTEVVALQSRTVGEVSTTIQNPNHDLLPGVTVNASIISKIAKDALAIPKASLHILNGQSGVYKLVGNTLQWTPVTTGVSDINNVQVLSGLHAGDLVEDRVIDPSDAEISSGMRIRARID